MLGHRKSELSQPSDHDLRDLRSTTFEGPYPVKMGRKSNFDFSAGMVCLGLFGLKKPNSTTKLGFDDEKCIFFQDVKNDSKSEKSIFRHFEGPISQ